MLSSRNLLMLTGVGAVIATAVLFIGVVPRAGNEGPLHIADAATTTPTTPTATTTTTTTTTSATSSAPATTSTSPSTSASPSAGGTDAQGYVDSAARCGDDQTLVVHGSTQRSRVVICKGSDGAYEYRGVRISDGASLRAAAEATGDGTYVATSDGAEYTVTREELEVTSGGKVIYRDTWVDYQTVSPTTTATTTTATSTTAPTTTSTTATTTATTTTTTTTTTSPQPR